MRIRDFQTEVLVAGGGPAGVACAVAAAREGAKVFLVQDRPVLGGNASSEIRMHIMGADAFGGEALATEAREGGILEEIRLAQAVENPQRSNSLFDLALYDLVRRESNITLLLNTSLTEATVSESEGITEVRAERPSTGDAFRIRAKIYVDCTGDGWLGFAAGADFRHGREDRKAHGETHASARADGKTLGSSLLYQARRHDRPMPFRAPAWARKFTAEDLRLRLRIDDPQHEDGLEYGFWWVEWGGELDAIRDNEQIRDELLGILMGVWDFIKNSGHYPGAANWALDWFGWVPGKRESRRFVGLHVLTEQDVLGAREFPDAIAFGGWPIDLHPPAGVDAVHEMPCHHVRVPNLYGIPLSSCISRNIPNLCFAGRNLSATHVAFASTRVMGTCFAVGEGLGTAVATAVRLGLSAWELASRPDAIRQIQQTILRNDGFLPGVRADDPTDLAQRAAVSANSEQVDAPARHVLSGFTRSTHGPGGTHPAQTMPGTHRWMSRPEDGLPARITLTWPEPVTVRQVQLIFDSGLHRVLTLSQSDKLNTRICWGQPQPELVADFRLEVVQDGSLRLLADIRNNIQRRWLLVPDAPLLADELRLTVTRTQGADHARVCEIRVY